MGVTRWGRRRGFFPKQWYTEGFWRLGKDIHKCFGRSLAPVARQLLCTGCGLGEGQVAPVHAKRSLAPLSTEKHICFGTVSFRSSSGPPLAQMPPRCLPNVSQMSPRCLPDASQMPLRCLQMLPPKNCLGSRAGGIFLFTSESMCLLDTPTFPFPSPAVTASVWIC